MPKEREKNYRIQKYRKEWEKEPWAHGWLSPSNIANSKAFCYVCSKDLVAGKSELKGHTRSSQHIRNIKTVEPNQPVAPLAPFEEVASYARIKAELNLIAMTTRKNISFNFLDQLVETLHFVADDSKAINGMTCNRTKGTYLMNECLAVYSHEKLLKGIKQARGVFILCDKPTDTTMKKVFSVSVRYLDQETAEPVTYLYRLIPIEDGNTNSLFKSLEMALDKDGIGWDKVAGYVSYGEDLMQEQNDSVLTRLKTVVPDLFVLKCFCHSFHLVASHACELLSKTAEQLVHDIYNYFKNSPSRQKSYTEFQHFVECEPHKILKPCQTRWLSLSQCVNKVVNQWPALNLFFTAEALGTISPAAQRIAEALQSPYIKATLEFTDFVLGGLTPLNTLFQSESFKLHRFLPEVERVVRMFCKNFMSALPRDVSSINCNDEAKWCPLNEVYPGILANETIEQMRPDERQRFLTSCRDWYREAVSQILCRIDLSDPVLRALKDIEPSAIIKGAASQSAAGVLAKSLPRLIGESNLQTIDGQWRSILIDNAVANGGWEKKGVAEFWKTMSTTMEYEVLAKFMLEVMTLPQSTAGVERIFSKVNKTRFRNSLSVTTVESIVKVREHFKDNFEVNERLVYLHANARNAYMEKYNKADRDCVEEDGNFP